MFDISQAEARTLALRAQRFGAPVGHPIELLDRLGAIQLDSVSVLARPQDLVAFARIGPHSIADMHRAVYEDRLGFEYWGHEASWLPMAEYRYFLPRMMHWRAKPRRRREAEMRQEYQALYPLILERIRAEGPLGAAAFEDPRESCGSSWWDWKPAKLVLEDLFGQGELMAAGRTQGFARLYDLAERVLPEGVDASDPGAAVANRHLMRRAVAALGVATGADAADYFRLAPSAARSALDELREAGEVKQLQVAGWSQPALCSAESLETPITPLAHEPTFLSPFDNVLWDRRRVERLFGFRYRIEMYVPESKRVYGYYVLPLLARGRLLGRADLKLDRALGVLQVKKLWLEGATAEEADVAISRLATHLAAASVAIGRMEPN